MATDPSDSANPMQPERRMTSGPSTPPAGTPPWHLTRFIGRQREIAEVKEQLADSRLLTLTGPGGSGKTRLAFEVALRYGKQMDDGSLSVELAALSDPSLIPQHIAASLGLQEQPGQPVARSLVAYLRSREMLLVLDNCEHVIEPVTEIADLILRGCPRVRILVTSREPLNLGGEVVWRVPGMSVPNPARPMPKDAVRASDACALFVDRAKLALPKFAFDEDSGSSIARICVRLDGIPLAIELAAALVRVLTVEQIDDRLEQRFELLTGGGPAVMPRHRTLRSTVDWSYDFLPEHERNAFRRLSVFAGSFGLEAAESVSSVPGELHTLELLSRLVDKSMVLAERTTPHLVRYRLLETLREYGQEKLSEAGDREVVMRRHADYFLQLAEESEARLAGPEQKAWMSRLDLDYDNVRVALGWSQGAEPNIGLRMAAALTRYWLMRGLWSEGRRWLRESLSKPVEDAALRAKGLLAAGTLAESHGDYAVAGALLENTAAEYGRLGDLIGMSRALIQHGRVDYYQGHYDLAQSRLEEGLSAARKSTDRWAEALALTELGTVAWRRAAYPEARKLAQGGLDIFRELGDRWNVGYAGDYLGHVSHSLKEYSTARRHFEESLSISMELNDLWGVAHSHANLGELGVDERELGAAEAHLVEAMERMQELGRPAAIMAVVEGFAGLAAAQGELQRAITLECAAGRIREEFGFAWRLDLRTRVEGWLPAARHAAGKAAVVKAERVGRAMNIEAAVSYALDGVATKAGRRPVRDVHEASPSLTRRELDIASLVAEGFTNRQIAARLFISQRTAETHVDRILTKLNFHSRAQIAVWATQRGLLAIAEPEAH